MEAARIAVPELEPRAIEGLDPAARVVDLGGETMGTRWSVRLAFGPDRSLAPVLAAIEGRLAAIVAQMSQWEPASLLCRYNVARPGSWIELPRDFVKVIAASLTVAGCSSGAFSPALGRLTDLWGLGPRSAQDAPDDEAIAAALIASDWRLLAFDPAARRLRQPGGLWLDLSGIAKGYAVDAVAETLRSLGIHHALIEVGGEFVGRGMRPDGDPWWIELENPPACSLPPLRIALHQLAVATSGQYLGAHTLDPRTGRPPTHETVAVSVLHGSCMLADAWASALGVLPPCEAKRLAVREGLAVRLVDRDGFEWLSDELRQML